MPNIKNKKYIDMVQKFNLQTNMPMSLYTSFRVGGSADLLALPETVEDLKSILAYANANDIPVTIIGGGTNIFVSDKGIRGLVIVTSALKTDCKSKEQVARRQNPDMLNKIEYWVE